MLTLFSLLYADYAAGAQKTKGAGGLLPALGIVLRDDRLKARATVLPLPIMMAGGIEIPKERSGKFLIYILPLRLPLSAVCWFIH